MTNSNFADFANIETSTFEDQFNEPTAEKAPRVKKTRVKEKSVEQVIEELTKDVVLEDEVVAEDKPAEVVVPAVEPKAEEEKPVRIYFPVEIGPAIKEKKVKAEKKVKPVKEKKVKEPKDSEGVHSSLTYNGHEIVRYNSGTVKMFLTSNGVEVPTKPVCLSWLPELEGATNKQIEDIKQSHNTRLLAYRIMRDIKALATK